jgi:hypothetical protein
MCNACGCKSAEEFGAEWRGRWDVGNERKSGEDYYFTYYIRKTEANPQAFEVLIRGRSPEGRELIRQASKNPIFRNLRYADKIKIGFFIRNEVNWEGNIIKGHYQVYLPKLVEGKRGKQVFLMTPSNLIMDNYGEPVIEGLYRTKQEAVNAIYYYFDEMEYPFHISNWPLENSWEFNWDEEFEAEEFEAWDANCSVCNGTGWMPKKGDPKKDAKIAKLFGLSIDELTLTPCNAGGKSMGCWSSNNRNRLRRLQRAEEFGAEGFRNEITYSGLVVNKEQFVKYLNYEIEYYRLKLRELQYENESENEPVVGMNNHEIISDRSIEPFDERRVNRMLEFYDKEYLMQHLIMQHIRDLRAYKNWVE